MKKYLIAAVYFYSMFVWQVKWHLESSFGVTDLIYHLRGLFLSEMQLTLRGARRIINLAKQTETIGSEYEAAEIMSYIKTQVDQDMGSGLESPDRVPQMIAFLSIYQLANSKKAKISFARVKANKMNQRCVNNLARISF